MYLDKDAPSIENGKITNVRIGFVKGSILTGDIQVEGDGWGVVYGGYVLDDYDEELGERRGTAYGCQKIRELLETFEVLCLDDLEGEPARAAFDRDPPAGSDCIGLMHFTKDKEFRWDPDNSIEKH